MANEMSPMAAESYAYNFFGEDLQSKSLQRSPAIEKTLWLSSNFGPEELRLRLREDPRKFPSLGTGHSDIADDGSNLNGSLIVGSIVELNKWLETRPKVAKKLKDGFGAGEVDVVSGGPPCQSFSMAGMRKKDCEKNSLPWEFAKFAQCVQPKIVLLENVTGILRPFRDERGDSYYAWFELAKAFAAIGYVPLCLHVNAKFAGVPQNRPRFILLGVREDFFGNLSKSFNNAEKELFSEPLQFFNKIAKNGDLPFGSLSYRDVAKPADFPLFRDSFLRPLVAHSGSIVTVRDAIDDLRPGGDHEAKFPKGLVKTFGNVLPQREMKNHELRNNNDHVRRRFRLYQILQQIGSDAHKRVAAVLRGEVEGVSEADWQQLSKFDYLVESGHYVTFKKKGDFLAFLKRHATKKQTQKALLEDQPAPAALSIPDDACHYHHDELRTLTVREMARIQSFPDSFEFRSKVTTGGQMRSFEVPQYTQVGNAVPPLLGRALGLAIENLLGRCAK